jgi:hypothetical protein
VVWLTVCPPSPHLFSDLRILKDFKCFVFGSADSEGVTGAFFGSADCKGVSGFRERKTFNAEGAEFMETRWRGEGLAESWGGEVGEGLLASCADKGVPACFFLPFARNGISMQENEIKSRE